MGFVRLLKTAQSPLLTSMLSLMKRQKLETHGLLENIVVYIGGGTSLSKLAEEDDSGELKKRKLDKTLGLPLAALGETIQEEGRYLELYYR